MDKYVRVWLLLRGDEQLAKKDNIWDDQRSGDWFLSRRDAEDQLIYTKRGPVRRVVPIDVPAQVFAPIAKAKTAVKRSKKSVGK